MNASHVSSSHHCQPFIDLKGKTLQELNELEASITSTLQSGEALDEEYWMSLLKRLRRQQNTTRYKPYLFIEHVHTIELDHRAASVFSHAKYH